MGRHAKPRVMDLDWDLQNLQERARVQCLTDALFRAQVAQAARVLIRLHPDIYRSLRDAEASALAILGAAEQTDHLEPEPDPRTLAHYLAEDHNGDPVCACGWNPADHFRVRVREDGRDRIREHVTRIKESGLTPGQDSP